jgi:hypothetical protein
MAGKGTSLWRMAGMSYLQYINKSASVLRSTLKEPAKTKLASRSNVEIAGFKWANGERGKRGMCLFWLFFFVSRDFKRVFFNCDFVFVVVFYKIHQLISTLSRKLLKSSKRLKYGVTSFKCIFFFFH